MKRFWERNTGLKLLALLTAIVLWFYVNQLETGGQQEIQATVPVVVKNQPAQLVIIEMQPTVNVRYLRGNKTTLPLWGNRTGAEVKAEVDLSQAKAGLNWAKVKVQIPEDARLLEVSPAQIAIRLEPWNKTR